MMKSIKNICGPRVRSSLCMMGVAMLPAALAAAPGRAATSGNFNPRTITSDSSTLSYNLYTTASHETVWGDGTNGPVTQTPEGLLTLDAVNLTVYGRVPADQFVNAGTYTDTITVSVEY